MTNALDDNFLNKLEIALKTLDTSGKVFNPHDRKIVHQAARAWGKVAPMIAELVEARKLASDSPWTYDGKYPVKIGSVARCPYANAQNNGKFIATAANIAQRLGEVLDETQKE